MYDFSLSDSLLQNVSFLLQVHWKAPPCVDHFILTVVPLGSHNIDKQIGFAYQSGRKCGVGSQRTCSHFFRLLAHILTFFDKNTVF